MPSHILRRGLGSQAPHLRVSRRRPARASPYRGCISSARVRRPAKAPRS